MNSWRPKGRRFYFLPTARKTISRFNPLASLDCVRDILHVSHAGSRFQCGTVLKASFTQLPHLGSCDRDGQLSRA